MPRHTSHHPGEPLCEGESIPGARPPGHASMMVTLVRDPSSLGVDTGRALHHLKGFPLTQSYETQYSISSGQTFRKKTKAVKVRLSFLACFRRGTRWKRLISRTGEEGPHRNAYSAMFSPALTGGTTLAPSFDLSGPPSRFLYFKTLPTGGRGFALFPPVCLGPRTRLRTKEMLTLWCFRKWVAPLLHQGYS